LLFKVTKWKRDVQVFFWNLLDEIGLLCGASIPGYKVTLLKEREGGDSFCQYWVPLGPESHVETI